jgi:hypothetical protein
MTAVCQAMVVEVFWACPQRNILQNSTFRQLCGHPYMVKKPKNRPCTPYMGIPYIVKSGNFLVNSPYMGVGYKLAEPKEKN